ncbi:hypothetical protein J2W21_000590 [Sinomonas atrocyanea]|uniref:hypothetical protein n=1 Tax=Sinomonas atrocyanea TaxID=37927 RepID=UPI00278B67CE|nr:hypothetical protein [Sinomonas atrocyanea]MDP9883100.1 hypothetical protein [Sinomonas atrocyanea]
MTQLHEENPGESARLPEPDPALEIPPAADDPDLLGYNAADIGNAVATKHRLGARTLMALVGALIVGGAIGGAITAAVQPDPTTTTPYVALRDTSSSQSATIASQSASIGSLESQQNSLQLQVDAAASQSAAIASAQASIQARESAVAQGEQELKSAQAVVSQNQMTGGVYVVGRDVQPGVYRTTGPDGSNGAGCYYAWKTGTDSKADIVDNNITSGVATATLENGQVFEVTGCASWTKVG